MSSFNWDDVSSNSIKDIKNEIKKIDSNYKIVRGKKEEFINALNELIQKKNESEKKTDKIKEVLYQKTDN